MTVRLPAPERRRQLLDIAVTTFAREGYRDASMQEMAQEAGVTKPVLYQHFASKRELYLEVMREVGDRLRDTVGQATATADGPRQQVEAGFAAYFRWVADHPDGFKVLFSGDNRRDREFLHEVAKVESEIAGAIAALIVVDGLAAERRLLLAYGIVGIAEVTCRHWLTHDLQLGPDDLASGVADLAWKGLRGLRPA